MSDQKTVFERVSELLRNKLFLVAVANACDNAYAQGTGNPDWYSPFGEDNWGKVSANIAALHAVDAAATLAASERMSAEGVHIRLDEQLYLEELQWIAELGKQEELGIDNVVSNPRLFRALFMPNVTWRQKNCAEGFERIDRPVGSHFVAQPMEEIQKDLIQAATAATMLLEKLETQS